ncbi:MAG TPA: toprim domain-containing protein, partial [Candidatus Binatus sp.]|nr:toprim domain-containing protein [Candidatus Binatus sp.]
MVCEKPDAASRVARALDQHGQPSRQLSQGVPFYECDTPSGQIIVCSALGHLYTIDSKGNAPRRFYPVWDYQWRAKNEVEPKKSARLKTWISTITSLARRADRFVNACDYDVEGALIGRQILRHACNGADRQAERMKFSTMTEK